MYPYPSLSKERRLRIRDLAKSGQSLIDLSLLRIEERKPTSPQMKRCVYSIASKEGGDRKALSKAFAICTAHLQKHGYLKDGSSRPTAKGKSAGKSKAAEKGHGYKVSAYEKILKRARSKK